MDRDEAQSASDARITRLQEDWRTLSVQLASGTLEADQQRAAILAQAQTQGLTLRQIAQAINVDYVYVMHLTRYHHFLLAVANKIPEGRFRAYWKEHADPHFRTRDPIKRAAYEESVFQYIAKQIDAGIPPSKPSRTIKRATNVDIRKKADPIRAYRKELTRRYTEEITPVVQDLKQLLGADRSTYAPSIIGGLAYKLETIFKELLALLDPVEE